MDKFTIMEDKKFKTFCSEFGIKDPEIIVCDNAIVVRPFNSDVYLFLDEDYNVFSIERNGGVGSLYELKLYAEYKYDNYANANDAINCGKMFSYPLENYSLKEILKIGSKIRVIELSHGFSSTVFVDGEWYSDDKKNDTIMMYSLIKFVSEEIKRYFLKEYENYLIKIRPTVDFDNEYSEIDGLEIIEYINAVFGVIDKNIKASVAEGKRPLAEDIILNLGQNSCRINNSQGMLSDIIYLYLQEMGYKYDGVFGKTLEETSKKGNGYLHMLATDILSEFELESENSLEKRHVIK